MSRVEGLKGLDPGAEGLPHTSAFALHRLFHGIQLSSNDATEHPRATASGSAARLQSRRHFDPGRSALSSPYFCGHRPCGGDDAPGVFPRRSYGIR